MIQNDISFGTGIPGLDSVLRGVIPGDNIVWQVDNIEDYIPFVHAFCKNAQKEKKKLIYFHFANHQFLLPDEIHAEVVEISPGGGFEEFLTKIFYVIEKFGLGACYVFDCLSNLGADWYSDVMLANFFRLTCPYLFSLDTATYFALIRNQNAAHAVKAIQNTAQVVIDLYRSNNEMYLHPLKADKRHSPTLYTLHRWDRDEKTGGEFIPVIDSITTAEILSKVQHPWINFSTELIDPWFINLRKSQEILYQSLQGHTDLDQVQEIKSKMVRMVIARRNDERFELAQKYFELSDLVSIGKRMIGTGLIGGKSVGMLLARAILRWTKPYWANRLEAHDTFFVGSDVFYTFLVKNKIWWNKRKICHESTFLEGRSDTEEIIRKGTFPKGILDQFKELLKYYGQSPIIVRSSSLQEDGFGNAFSGKYESVFLANQGNPELRLGEFIAAIRTIYASTISIDALTSRKTRGLLENEEQMAILVQRVSGSRYGEYFLPQIAGVGFSFNPFCWNEKIDPNSGFLRLVFGLGTRAVDRTEDDYTRLIALNSPGLRPEHNTDDIVKYSQKKVDIIDLKQNAHLAKRFKDVVSNQNDMPLDLFLSNDHELERRLRERGREGVFTKYISFDNLIAKTNFTKDLEEILKILKEALNTQVDIEYTANFRSITDYKINLLQCRPFQVKLENQIIEMPAEMPDDKIIMRTSGPIIGTSVAAKVDMIIYIVPSVYGKLPIQDRYAIARLIGKITHYQENIEPYKKMDAKIMLIGPGRWGTSSPSLGIPISFSEINTVSILGEIAEMHEGLIPDVSLGSHFFNDLVELDMLYFALYPTREGNTLNRQFFLDARNQLTAIIPDAGKWEHAIKVITCKTSDISLNINTLTQKGVVYGECNENKEG